MTFPRPSAASLQRSRQPAGTPVGGRFAPGGRQEPQAALDGGPGGPTFAVELPDEVKALCEVLSEAGMRPLLVGGSVRDAMLGAVPKDLDFEVYGADLDEVAAVAGRLARVDEVGRQFGVLKARLRDGSDVDLSVPRRDNKVGAGHRGFEIVHDPNMSVEEAASRRDFTINAMSWDPASGELLDPFGGRADLEQRVLRHVSEAFDEDPLRVLRGAQFAARFDMRMDPQTADRCRALAGHAGELARERVWGEWAKLYEKGVRPSAGLKVLAVTEWDRTVPGLSWVNDGLLGDQADRAVRLARDGEERTVVAAAVIACRIGNHHARFAGGFIDATVEGSSRQRLALALHNSMPPGSLSEAALRTAALCGPGTIRQRCMVDEALTGRAHPALAAAVEAGVADGPEADLLAGRDVLPLTDRRPGPWVGDLLRQARAAQAAGEFRNREDALAWAAKNL